MGEVDWDDPGIEEQWCHERRKDISDYLAKEGLDHGEIGSWPAWHVVPYVSLWAIESLRAPGQVGWWAISGDLPTDYISASDAGHPRKAMLSLADAWRDLASHKLMRIPHPEMSLGPPAQDLELASLLQSRSALLRRFAEDDAFWGPEYD